MFRIFASVFLIFPTSAFADVWTFETPSQNIQCVVGQGVSTSDLTCTIIKRTGNPALPRPSGCNAEWGHVFFMNDHGPVEMQCSDGQHLKGGFDRADYGVTGKFGGFTCHSSKKGLKCTNRDNNGFFLSRKKQVIIGKKKPTRANIQANKEGLILKNIKVETLLSAIGIDPGPVDGLINEQTVRAIHQFQKRYDLPQQDVISDEQLAVLEALAKVAGTSNRQESSDKSASVKKPVEVAVPNEKKLEVPVLERGTNEDLPTCASSVVSNTRANVRSGPGERYEKIDQLKKAEIVYVFDQRGSWAGIVYRTKNVECSSKRTRKVPYTFKGWVHKKLLRELAG